MHRACDHTQRPSQAQHEIQARQCSLAASNLASTDDHHNYDHTRPIMARAVCVIVAQKVEALAEGAEATDGA